MARPGKARPKAKASPSRAINSPGKRIENYEDTLEPGGVDDLMFQRDRILFDDSLNANQDNDINADQGEDVLAIPEYGNSQEFDDVEDDEEFELAESSSSKRKGKAKVVDNAKRGRFAKEDLEEDDEGSDNGSSSDEGGWGRQYYSKPSNRRAKEDPTQFEASREEERELEEHEVKRLQKKARSSVHGQDWGFDAEAMATIAPAEEVEQAVVETVEAPQTDDPATLLRHMETHETLKLALARELPLVIEKLEKTSRGMKALHENQTSEGTLQKGLGWLHYQILLTYSSTLAYYIHLCALPSDSRPNLTEHPILDRLLHLKEGLAQLEDLDFAADSDTNTDEGEEEEDDEEAQLMQNKRELMLRMFEMAGVSPNGAQSEEDLDESWRTADLEDGELDALLAEADGDELEGLIEEAEQISERPVTNGPSRSIESKKKKKKAKKTDIPLDETALGGLVEPEFQAMGSSRPAKSARYDDVIGDPTSLDEADASDKEHRKRSLQFHTSKINSTSARRAAARTQRFGGDDDIPRRDRQAARDAVLKRSGPAAPLEDDDGMAGQWLQDKDEAMDVSNDTGYYDLVQRNQAQKKAAKDAAHLEAQSERQRVTEDPHEGGPRALTRAIEKNRGLTPRRSKSSRNPRVKKRMAYDKAKKKVSSQGPVFKGGQSSLQGRYAGETSGISSAIRSKRF